MDIDLTDSGRCYATAFNSKVIGTEPWMAMEMVQRSLVAIPMFWSSFSPIPSRPSITPLKCDDLMRIPSAAYSAEMVAVTLTRCALPPRWAIKPRSPMPKQVAWEAASNSSGVVWPDGSPLIRGYVAGTLNSDDVPLTVPEPRITSPVHSKTACREKVAILDHPR